MAQTRLLDEIIRISARVDDIRQAAETLRQGMQSGGSSDKFAKIKQFFASAKQSVQGHAKPILTFLNKFMSVFKTVLKGMGVMTFMQVVVKSAQKAKQLITDTVKLGNDAAAEAKKSGKTLEKYRAEQLALQAIGKSLNEIEKDSKLKKLYDDLVKLGESYGFQNAGAVKTSLSDVGNEVTKLRFVLRMGLAQVYEYFKVYAAKPMAQLKSWFEQWLKSQGYAFDKWPQAVGKAMAKLFKAIVNIAQSVTHTVDAILEGFDMIVEAFGASSKEIKIGLGIIAGILALWVLPFKPIMLLFMLFYLLIDDYVTWQNGGASALGDAWITISKVFNAIADWLRDDFEQAVKLWIQRKVYKKLMKKGGKALLKILFGEGKGAMIGNVVAFTWTALEGLSYAHEDAKKDPGKQVETYEKLGVSRDTAINMQHLAVQAENFILYEIPALSQDLFGYHDKADQTRSGKAESYKDKQETLKADYPITMYVSMSDYKRATINSNTTITTSDPKACADMINGGLQSTATNAADSAGE